MPARCISCGIRPADHPFPLCRVCRLSLRTPANPIHTHTENVKMISSCGYYQGALMIYIKRLKFAGDKRMLPILRDIAINTITRTEMTSDLIIPVPMHPFRKRARGYNQSELLSGVLSEATGLSMDLHTLLKIRNTPAQTGLSRADRLKNLSGSFTVVDRPLIVGKRVLVVDDIVTTGATLDICGGELLRAGASEVHGFTLARTP